jgi:hypothetical protein
MDGHGIEKSSVSREIVTAAAAQLQVAETVREKTGRTRSGRYLDRRDTSRQQKLAAVTVGDDGGPLQSYTVRGNGLSWVTRIPDYAVMMPFRGSDLSVGPFLSSEYGIRPIFRK